MTRLVQLQNGDRSGASRWSRSRSCACSTDAIPSTSSRRRRLQPGSSSRDWCEESSTGETHRTTTAVYHGDRSGGCCRRSIIPTSLHRCLVSGTGLTHLGSAKDRQAMHAVDENEMTDSMKMFRWGVEGGRPAPGQSARRRMVLQGQRHDAARARRAARHARLMQRTAAKRRRSPASI